MEAGSQKIRIESLPARDGNEYLSITIDSSVYRMNSNYRPLAEAQKWAEGQELAPTGAIVLMYGMGNGYCAKALLARMTQDAVLILWEPSVEIYEYMKEQSAVKDVLRDSRVHLLVQGKNERDIFALLDKKISWANAKKQHFCMHPQYDKAFPTQLALFEEIIRNNNIRVYTNRNTEMFFGTAIAENTAHNLRYVPSAFVLQDMIGAFPKGVPAIIVSAGPSLDKNIEELKRAKGKAVIVATDTALRALAAHTVVPDFAVILDPKKPPSYFCNPESRRIPLFAQIQANREVLSLHETEKIWFDSHMYMNRFYERIGRKLADYHAGGSVATAAFSICSALGFERIVLIGQDLAFKDGVTHAGGQVCGVKPEEEEKVCYVEGINGALVKSRNDWLQYLKWFERVIGEIQGEIDVIDATEGGALIRGTRLMTLSEVIDQYCQTECDAYAIMKKHCRELTQKENAEFKSYIQESLKEAESLKQLTKTVCGSCMEAMQKGTVGASKQGALRAEISHIGEQIQKMQIFSLIDDYAKQVSVPAITEMLEAEGSEEECFRVYIENTQKVYKAFEDAVLALVPLLQLACK